MTLQQKIFSILIALIIFIVILDMVRRKKLREELSFIWLLAGLTILLLSLWERLLLFCSNIMGIKSPVSFVFFMGIVYLILMNLQLSMKISVLSDHVKKMAQKIAILELETKGKEEKEDGP